MTIKELNSADVENTFRLADQMIYYVREGLYEYSVFRDGWNGDGETIPAGNPHQLQTLIIKKLQPLRDDYATQILPVVATLERQQPIIYPTGSSGPHTSHVAAMTAMEAVACLADIFNEACAKLVFNARGEKRRDIPRSGTAEFTAECSACAEAMKAVTAEELVRVESLLRREWVAADAKVKSRKSPESRVDKPSSTDQDRLNFYDEQKAANAKLTYGTIADKWQQKTREPCDESTMKQSCYRARKAMKESVTT